MKKVIGWSFTVALFLGISIAGKAQYIEKRNLTREDKERLNPGDKIVADVIIPGGFLWRVEPGDGTAPYGYWGNPSVPEDMVWTNGNIPEGVYIVVCGQVYCCEGSYVDIGHARLPKCAPGASRTTR